MTWTVDTFGSLVDEEIGALRPELRVHLRRVTELIVAKGPEHTGMPYVRRVRGPIWEIRFQGHGEIGRALYATMIGKRIIILWVFQKKTEKTPTREIELAMSRYRSMLA
jgi:phage-related protein